MDYEKLYKDALENAKKEYNTTENVGRKQWLEELFPELKESEDERIRKAIICGMNALKEQHKITFASIPINDCVAWLKKQKSIREIVERCKNSWYNEGKIAGMAEGLTDDEKYQQGWHDALEKQGEQKSIIEMKSPEESLGISSKEYNEIVNDCLYGEQKPADMVEPKDYSSIDPHFFKPADKVEPKFKVGNWITNGHCKCQITFIDSRYWYSETCVLGNVIDIDKTFHLWTIQDAKDGDILVNGSNIFIFHFINDTRLMGYCHVNTDDGRFYDDIGKNECFCLIDAVVTPATKEQRELLFQKMKEAGYTFDFEKKKLRKIHVIDEGKAEMDYCFTKMMNNEKVSPTWTEADDEELEIAIHSLIGAGQYDSADWLTSLKEKYTWKPSDEQMVALEYIINNAHNTSHSCKIAKELLEQLKKLK